MRVLVVEPNAYTRSQLGVVLRRAGHEAVLVADGAAALAEIAAHDPPQAIVSEILVPGMDGFALCRELRRRGSTAALPFLFYTESDEPGAQRLARRVGADAFIPKSAGDSALLAGLNRPEPDARDRRGGADLVGAAADPQFLYEHVSCLFGLLAHKVEALESRNQDLTARAAFLRAVIEAEPECVKLVAPDGSLLEMNAAGLRMLEADSLAQAQEHPLHQFVAEEDREAFRALMARVLSGETGSLTFRTIGLRGGRRWLETHARPLRDEAGKVMALVGVTHDITERQEAEDALREAEARLRLATQSAQIGIWDWNLETGALTWSTQHEALWGLAPGAFRGTLEDALAHVHPDDREPLERALRAALDERRPLRHEFRVLWPDRTVHWMASRGEPHYEAAGRAVRMLGTVMDITEARQAEEELRESRRTFQTLLTSLPGTVYRCRNDERWTAEFASEGCRALTGYSPEEFTSGAVSYADLIHPDDRTRVWNEIQAGLARGGPFQLVYRIRTRTGEEKIAWGHGQGVPDAHGRIAFLEGYITDVTKRIRAEEKVRHLNRVHAILSGISGLIVRARDRDQLFREATRLAVEAGQIQMAWIGVVDRGERRVRPVAWAGEERGMLHEIEPRLALDAGADGRYTLVGQAVADQRPLVVHDAGSDPRLGLPEALINRSIHSLTVLPLVIGGEVAAVLTLLAREPGFFDDAEMQLLNQLASDIAFALDHLGKEEQLSYLARFDALTGLANRELFHERLEQFVHGAARDQGRLALCMIDLDHFKYVNDSLGRQAGDALLAQFGQRLQAAARDATHVARLGADRFALILPEAAGESAVAGDLERLRVHWTAEPFLFGGDELRMSARVGVALFPADGTDADTLFRNSEAALKKAKSAGDPVLFYHEQMTNRVAEKLALETRLRRAVEKQEFEVHYQPKVDTATRAILGVEALIRWRDPQEGLIMPIKFIPLLEESGIIADAGAWVLEQAVRDYDYWLAQGVTAPRVAVNVSAVQLRRRDFPDTVRRALGGSRTPAPIELEITESVLMENIEENLALLNALHEQGIGIAIDDFGTGYSSLGYLARLPTQTLKIDLSFIDRMLTDRDVLTLVSTMISLAHSMRLRVVAEGVETEKQAEVLARLKCDELQGYLISPPVPREHITEMLRSPQARGEGRPRRLRRQR